jgi:hypothetical protein
MARSAAGVSTALSWEVGAGLTEEASTSPVAALRSGRIRTAGQAYIG